MKYFISLKLFLFIACFSACKKENIELVLSPIQTPTKANLFSIYFADNDNGYAVGGTRWEHGELLSSTDGGASWTTDTLTNTALLDIQLLDNEKMVLTGYEGRYLYKTNALTSWQNNEQAEAEPINAIHFYNENTGVAVGGKNFAFGIIYRWNNINGTADTIHYPLSHELRDVQFTNENTVHTVGYGYVAKSDDGGLNWQAADIQGDFFYALHFPTEQTGYAVGVSGTIIKTTDGGENWEKIRNGNSLFVTNKKFRDVWFKDESIGYIIGDNGLFWQTNDGGDSWKVAQDTPDVDFNQIYINGNTAYIAADEGMIYEVALN